MTKKIDMLIKKAAFFEKLATGSDRISLLQAIADTVPTGYNDPQWSENIDAYNEDREPISLHPDTKPLYMGSPGFNSDVKRVQEILKQNPKYAAVLGKTGPNKDGVDGEFGPNTGYALSLWRKDHNVPMSVSDEIMMKHIIQGTIPPGSSGNLSQIANTKADSPAQKSINEQLKELGRLGQVPIE
jgi:hypothetical protein